MDTDVTKLQIQLTKPTMELPDPGLLMMYHNLNTRDIWLDEEINWDTCAFIVQYIQFINSNPEERQRKNPITLHIMSPGGELPTMFTLYDTIRKSHVPVHTINEGACHSAAFIVFLAGDLRSMKPHATFIAHEGSGVLGGSYRENKAAMDQYEKDVSEMRHIIADRTGIPMEEIIKRFEESQDWYIRQDYAESHGILTPLP